jgi:transposase
VRVVYPVCCGVDVHKTFLVATILTTTKEGTVKYKKDRFSTFNKSLIKLRDWLLANNCNDVCMESTGKYYIPVFNVLEEGGFHVTVANPKWVAVIKGNKDDVKDSRWIGELFRLGLVPGSFIPPKPIRVLREYTRYRYKLVCCKSAEKNRYQNAFTVCNIALDAVVSDMFGKSAGAILDYIVDGDSFDPKHCVTLLHRSMRRKADQVVESIEGFQMTEEQKQRIRFIKSHHNFVESLLEQMDRKIDEVVAPYENAISLLQTIPGVGRRSVITILSEIGADMSQFASSDKLSNWAGLAPSNNQSAGKKKSVKTSRAGAYIKPALVEAAHAAVMATGSPYYKVKYERISKRRGKKRAIIAIARMLLVAVYHMLRSGEAWNPVDLARVDMPQELHVRQQKQAIKQAANFLIKHGVVLPEHVRLTAA